MTRQFQSKTQTLQVTIVKNPLKKMGSETSPLKKRFIRWMEDNRGLILTVIGLPASFLFDLVMRVSIFRLIFSKIQTKEKVLF